jgi:hypothetical protein
VVPDVPMSNNSSSQYRIVPMTEPQWPGSACVTVESYPILSVTYGTLPVLTALAEHDSNVGIN